jgi:hypothetical protein
MRDVADEISRSRFSDGADERIRGRSLLAGDMIVFGRQTGVYRRSPEEGPASAWRIGGWIPMSSSG